jgi:tetratricopeptide (TPR) repeat protein
MNSDWQDLLDDAAEALESGDHHEALQLCDQAAMAGDEARYHAAVLRGDVLLDLGDAAGALSSFETVADPTEEDPELDCARGVALFELGRLAEADNALRSAIRGNPELAEAHYTLGLIAELLGSGQEGEYFRRARRLDPDAYPPQPPVSRDEFEEAIGEAVARLKPGLRQALEHVPVLIAELPHPDDLRNAEPPLSPLSYGMFVGTPPSLSGTVMDAPDAMQPAMVLFKRNLERGAVGHQALVDEIRRTVTHELGFALGLSEDEVAQSSAD